MEYRLVKKGLNDDGKHTYTFWNKEEGGLLEVISNTLIEAYEEDLKTDYKITIHKEE